MKPFIIGIAGGTGSGKSTFTNRLKDHFGDRIALLCHDNYYRVQDHKSMEERRANNYDHPDALETELLVEHLKALSEGKDIFCPVYDFTTHTRYDQTILVKARPVILVVGILIFHDQALSNMFDLKIFVDVDADERILRRVARDVKERGREVEDVMEQYLTKYSKNSPTSRRFV